MSALFRVTVGVVFLEALVLNMLHLHCKALKSSNNTVYIKAASIKKILNVLTVEAIKAENVISEWRPGWTMRRLIR